MNDGIRIYWDDDIDGLLIGEMSGETSWEKYHTLHDRVFEHIAATNMPRVDFIFLLKTGTPNTSPFSHMKRTSKHWRKIPNAQEYVMVIENRQTAALANALLAVAKRIASNPTTKTDYRVVSSLQEARDLIRERREAAPPRKDNMPSE